MRKKIKWPWINMSCHVIMEKESKSDVEEKDKINSRRRATVYKGRVESKVEYLDAFNAKASKDITCTCIRQFSFFFSSSSWCCRVLETKKTIKQVRRQKQFLPTAMNHWRNKRKCCNILEHLILPKVK